MLYGAEVLETPSAPVTNISDNEIQLVRDMVETMYHASGVGLAAPQVGVGKRIMVTDPTGGEKKSQIITLINPEIVSSEGEQYEDEGCLSIPGFSAAVVRPARVVLKGLDLNGKEVSVEGRDLLARAFCHEMDHLNGVVFLDHLSFLKRDIIRRKIKKLMKQGEWKR